MENLFFELPVGLRINGEIHTNVELLSTNGVAEKIFLKDYLKNPILGREMSFPQPLKV